MTFRILCGDARETLATLPDASVHCCVTSPPYFGLRDYGAEGQIGLEPTPDAYATRLVEVFREVRRILRDDGTLWLNLGDSYNAAGREGHGTRTGDKQGTNRASANGSDHTRPSVDSLKPKDLIGIPWLVAFALRADGWYLRSDIIWAKPNPMPESVTDRPTKAHEYLFLLSKSERYYYDAEAIKEAAVTDNRPRSTWEERREVEPVRRGDPGASGHVTTTGTLASQPGRNRRTVWTVATQPFSEAHFATMPRALVEPCIKAGTSERGVCPECGAPWERVTERREVSDTGAAIGGDPSRQDGGTRERDTTGRGGNQLARTRVATSDWRPTCAHDAAPVPAMCLDPFNGAGTTGLVATRLQRRYTGIDVNPDYVAMSERRIRGDAPLFLGIA